MELRAGGEGMTLKGHQKKFPLKPLAQAQEGKCGGLGEIRAAERVEEGALPHVRVPDEAAGAVEGPRTSFRGRF